MLEFRLANPCDSATHLLCPNLGWIPYPYAYSRHCLRTRRRHPDPLLCIRLHCVHWWWELLATVVAVYNRHPEICLHPRPLVWTGIQRMVHGIWWRNIGVQYNPKVLIGLSPICSTVFWLSNASTLNVFHARRSRGQRTRIALLGLIPFFLAWALIPAYLYFQPIILYHHLIPFVFFVGLINAYSVGQIIVAHLTKSRFPFYNVLVLPLLFSVLDSVGPYLLRVAKVIGWPSALGNDVYQVAFVFCCLGLAIGVYGSFVIDVIFTICDYLDIWCLTIKHPYQPMRENVANGSPKDSKIHKQQWMGSPSRVSNFNSLTQGLQIEKINLILSETLLIWRRGVSLGIDVFRQIP